MKMNKSRNTPRKFIHPSMLGMIIIILLASACAPNIPPATATPTATAEIRSTATQTATPWPTSTPTLPPLGSEGNPITIGFILKPEQTASIEAAEDIAFLIGQDTGLSIESTFYPDFQSLSVGVINGDVDLFWLKPLEYIYLNWEGAAQVMLLTNHLGVYAYGVQFMANIERGFISYYDPELNASTGDPVAALQQFSGTRPCFTEPNSLPGHLLPLGLLADTSTPTLDPVFTYSYDAVIRTLYIQGICDFGVGYALTGDPRTSSGVLQDLPEAQEVVEIIWQSDGIIPNTNLSTAPGLPLDIRYKLQEAILDIPNTPEGLTLISASLNYDVEALKTIEDTFYNPLRAAIIPLELDLQALTWQETNP
jgi:ABC-type phosphate/phosphonate transport system substrate-binding protein